jgi:dihydroorotate dehydrogenase
MSTEFPAPSLEFAHPLMNAAGSLGFASDPRGPVEMAKFGAFVTNPISTRPRKAANPPSLVRFSGGVLLHTGFPNPGLSGSLKQYVAAWKRSSVPIIVHLLSGKPEEMRKAVLHLEELENVMAVELGFEVDSSADLVTNLIHAATGELPVIAQAPLTRAVELAEVAMEAGASAISLGPPRGSLMASGKLVSGRLYGPAILPQALEAVMQISQAGFPVIGAGGVQSDQDAESMITAGAMAVQVDIGLWK